MKNCDISLFSVGFIVFVGYLLDYYFSHKQSGSNFNRIWIQGKIQRVLLIQTVDWNQFCLENPSISERNRPIVD